MSLRDLIDNVAESGGESEDEELDEETGEPVPKLSNGQKKKPKFDDSSDEDEEEDEEAEREVREGFIDDDEEEDDEERRRRRRERKKRRREEREEEDDLLDEEDLDLIGETVPGYERPTASESKFKRLKRGHKEDRGDRDRGVGDIFASDEEDELDDTRGRPLHPENEFDDFIEEDFEGDEGAAPDEDLEVTRVAKKGYAAIKEAYHGELDEAALEDYRLIFGDGTEYDWALAIQEREEQEGRGVREGSDEIEAIKAISLEDVFEPSQLAEKMLTVEDIAIRSRDEPERLQLARKPYKDLVLTTEEFREEATWISNNMVPRRRLDPELGEPFQKSVAKVLEFMTTDEVEVPFIWQHRRDFLIANVTIDGETQAERLMSQEDLWEIFDQDLKFRAFITKRRSLLESYGRLKEATGKEDPIIEEMLPAAMTMEELQDIQEYLYFQHSARLADLSITSAPKVNGTSHSRRRPVDSKNLYDKIRHGPVYNLVRAFGVTPDDFAKKVLQQGRHYTEDPGETPEQYADSDEVKDDNFSRPEQRMKAAKSMLAREISLNPRFRKHVREHYFRNVEIDCVRTELGMKRITESHPYSEIKYLRNQVLADIPRQPDVFLKMFAAEAEGYAKVEVRMKHPRRFKEDLYQAIESDNTSDLADAWNKLRHEVLDDAMAWLGQVMVRSIRTNVKNECEAQIIKSIRNKFSDKCDQAPFKPHGLALGSSPAVLTMAVGAGERQAIMWSVIDDEGALKEHGKFSELKLADEIKGTSDNSDVGALLDVLERRKVDVIGVGGMSIDAHKLFRTLSEIIERKALKCPQYEDSVDDEPRPLELIVVNDEVARLYWSTERAHKDYPTVPPMTRYCVALAKYLQNPLKQYASLGNDLIAISFDPCQRYIDPKRVMKELETVLVDYVNLVGVEIDGALRDPALANLLQYVCGLGPRKAQHFLKTVNRNGGRVSTRSELVGDLDAGILAAVPPRVWNNCASFLIVDVEEEERETEILDKTRVHPEDYELARKMAADALELDEEDISAEVNENGPGAVVKRLFKEDATERVNDLILEEYANQLESTFKTRKRATLETIRGELQNPYEELRRNFAMLNHDEIFTMFTGETRESLHEDSLVTMRIHRVFDDRIEGALNCGIDVTIELTEISDDLSIPIKSIYRPQQVVQVKVLRVDRKYFTAKATLLERKLRENKGRDLDRMADEWDFKQEEKDKELIQAKTGESKRFQRVVKHPLFRPWNWQKAEEWLGSQNRGECIIRPSSKGQDHLCVSWKVADGIYQHLDILELDKENDFSVGRTLRVEGRWTYSDLDDLIVNHVKAMSKKVEEMMQHEKFHSSPRAEVDRWLTTYLEANPRRSMYAYCFNPGHPGSFLLLFKVAQDKPCQSWPVDVIPGAFELLKVPYQNMMSLTNGFKIQHQNMIKKRQENRR